MGGRVLLPLHRIHRRGIQQFVTLQKLHLRYIPSGERLYRHNGRDRISGGMSTRSQTRSESPLAARYEALFRVSQALSVRRDPEELFRVLENELRRVVTSDFVSFFLYDEVGNKMCARALHLLNRPAVPVPSEIGGSGISRGGCGSYVRDTAVDSQDLGDRSCVPRSHNGWRNSNSHIHHRRQPSLTHRAASNHIDRCPEAMTGSVEVA